MLLSLKKLIIICYEIDKKQGQYPESRLEGINILRKIIDKLYWNKSKRQKIKANNYINILERKLIIDDLEKNILRR